MNAEDYRGAVDRLVPAPELKGRILARLESGPAATPVPRRRRAGRAVLAAAAVVACTVLVALASSPDFRAALLVFFHLEEAEQVPAPSGSGVGDPAMTQEVIARQVEVQYIRLPGVGSGYSYGSGTLYQVERDDLGRVLSVRFWGVGEEDLVPLETKTTDFSTTWDGVTYTDTVYWCEFEGEISCYCNGSAGMVMDIDWGVGPLSGGTDAVLLTLSQGSQMDYRQYPVLLDLATGSVTDLLGGTGWEVAAPLTQVQWNSDLSAAVLRGNQTGWFYCDREAGTTVDLSELTGVEIVSASFAGEDAVILLTWSGPDGACWDVWVYRPAAGALTRTFSELPVYSRRDELPYGMEFFFGGGRALYVAPEGTVSVLDLLTGQATAVADFNLREWGGGFIANSAGNKLLFNTCDPEVKGLGIRQLGVIDLEDGVFTVLDREGYDALYEVSLGWFDEDRVAIVAYGAEDYGVQVLSLYRF